jgi:hypothetical protein
MVEIVIIEISLVDANAKKTNKEIKEEIFNGLSEGKLAVPCLKKLRKSL